MRDFKSIKQMQRVLRTAGDKSAEAYRAKLKAEKVEMDIERKLKERIAQEQTRLKYETEKEENPLKYKALMELEKIWNSGKKGFIKHLVLAYGGGNASPYMGDNKNVICALTKTPLITFSELSEIVGELATAGLNDMVSRSEPDFNPDESETHKILKGRIRALTGQDTTTFLCDPALEALLEFGRAKILRGDLELFSMGNRDRSNHGRK